MEHEEIIKKVVFKEVDTPNRSKALFGTVRDLGDFLEVNTKKGIFTINKQYIVFIKEGDYKWKQ